MVKLTYTTDTSQYVEQVRKANDEAGPKAQNAIKGTTQAHQRLSAVQKQMLRETTTAQEKYNAKLKALKDLYGQGKIGADKYKTAVTQVTKEYHKTTHAADDAGDANKGAFGDGAVSMIKGFGGAVLGVAGPIMIVKKGLEEIIRLEQDAAAMGMQSKGSIGQLRQLADTQGQFDALKGKAQSLFKSGATQSLEDAAKVVFSLQSANLMGEGGFELFGKLGTKNVIPDLGSLATSVRTQISAFGRGETGNAKQIISKAFAASGYSPSSAEALLRAASMAGASARLGGIGDEETLAGTAVMATATGSADIGATSLRSFIDATNEDNQFAGMSIAERVRKISGMGLSPAGLKKQLGRKEAIRAQSVLSGALDGDQGLLAITAAVQAANVDTSSINRKLSFRDPVSRAATLRQQGDADIATDYLPAGGLENLRQKVLARRWNESVQKYGRLAGGILGAYDSMDEGARAYVSSPSRFFDRQLANDRNVPSTLTDEEAANARELLELQRQQLEEQKITNRKLSEGGLIGTAE